MGKAWKEASEEERGKMYDEYRKDLQEWRREAGAGVRYRCYYNDPGPLDGYGHHVVFEVDEASNARAIRDFYAKYQFDRLAIDVVSGGTFHDEVWTS